MTLPILIIDSVTVLDKNARSCVLITGSHGGNYAALCAAKTGVRAVIFNDAGVGKDEAGIAGLKLLQDLGVAAAAVDAATAQIGRAQSTFDDGAISHANALARGLGVTAGLPCRDAAAQLVRAALAAAQNLPATESRERIAEGPPAIWALDSASLVTPQDQSAILFIGSHGGLLGGRPETALKFDARAAVFNDAGIGFRRAGVSRLPALDARGIAAATVSAASARIGDGRSTYRDGIISEINSCAERCGGRIGMPAREFADALAKALS